MIKNIIVPIDFSEDSLKGLDLAILFANANYVNIQMVYVQKSSEDFRPGTYEEEYRYAEGEFKKILGSFEGKLKNNVRALWLNSPFLDWRESHKAKLRVAQMLGWFSPYLHDPKAVLPEYVRSLHRNWEGEWDFDLALKPLMGFPAYFGWVRAIFAAHAKVHAGLRLDIPVLSMHSDEADIVLAWKPIARWSRTLGTNVTVLSFPGALHDLVLSRREIREAVFSQLFAWAARA